MKNKDLESILTGFNTIASKMYMAAINQLEGFLLDTSRNTEENVFRMRVARHFDLLKRQLEDLARERLANRRNSSPPEELRAALSSQVNFYLQEFSHKANSL